MKPDISTPKAPRGTVLTASTLAYLRARIRRSKALGYGRAPVRLDHLEQIVELAERQLAGGAV